MNVEWTSIYKAAAGSSYSCYCYTIAHRFSAVHHGKVAKNFPREYNIKRGDMSFYNKKMLMIHSRIVHNLRCEGHVNIIKLITIVYSIFVYLCHSWLTTLWDNRRTNRCWTFIEVPGFISYRLQVVRGSDSKILSWDIYILHILMTLLFTTGDSRAEE